jgi:hypothetical protein
MSVPKNLNKEANFSLKCSYEIGYPKPHISPSLSPNLDHILMFFNWKKIGQLYPY